MLRSGGPGVPRSSAHHPQVISEWKTGKTRVDPRIVDMDPEDQSSPGTDGETFEVVFYHSKFVNGKNKITRNEDCLVLFPITLMRSSFL